METPSSKQARMKRASRKVYPQNREDFKVPAAKNPGFPVAVAVAPEACMRVFGFTDTISS
jgi:hypothetical protein